MDNITVIRIVAGLLTVFFSVGLFVGYIFYILTLDKTLKRCSPNSRTIQPGLLWLLLIPLFNIFWHFLVVSGMAQSLGNEFRARRTMDVEPEPGKSLGIAMCICTACSIIPVLGILAALASLILWIMYWSKIAGFSRRLGEVAYVGATPSIAPGI